jgi:hypothetical protein
MSGEIHQQNDRNANVNVGVDTGQITVPEAEIQEQQQPPGGLGVKGRYQDVVEKDPNASASVAVNLYSSQPKLPLPTVFPAVNEKFQDNLPQVKDAQLPSSKSAQANPASDGKVQEQVTVPGGSFAPKAPQGGGKSGSADPSESNVLQQLLDELEAQQELDQQIDDQAIAAKNLSSGLEGLTGEKNVPSGTDKQSPLLHQQSTVYQPSQKMQDLHKTSADALGVTTAQDFIQDGADVKKAKKAQAAVETAGAQKAADPQLAQNTANALDGIPGITSSVIPAPDSAAAGLLRGSIKFLQDSQSILQKYAPQGKGMIGVSIFDMLKSVSQALSNAQQMLYEVENRNTLGRKDVTNAQWDEQKSQIQVHQKAYDDQKAQQAEIDKHQKKANITNLVLKILTPIVIAVSIIATIASFGTLSPLACFVSTVMVAAMVTSTAGGPNWMADAIQGAGGLIGKYLLQDTFLGPIMKACGMSDDQIKSWCKLIGEVLAIVIIIVATRDPAAGRALTAAWTSQLLGASNVVADTLVQCGVSQMNAQIAGACVVALVGFSALGAGVARTVANRAQTIVAMEEAIATTETQIAARAAKIAAAVDEGIEGGNVATSAAKMAYEKTQGILDEIKLFIQKSALTIFKEDAEKTADTVKVGMELAQDSTAMAQADFENTIKRCQARIKTIKASEDAQSTQLDDYIQALKIVIKQLLDMMNALVQGVATIDQLQIKKYEVAKVQFRA